MNERIKELAEQSGMNRILNEHASEYGNGTIDNTPYPELQAFAELIVQECVSTLNEMHLYQSVNNQNYPSVWHNAVDQSIDTIKEHFGVE